MTQQQQDYHGFVGYTWARQLAESRFLRGKSVPFPKMVEAYYMLFQTGVVLGRAQTNRGAQLAELFAPGRSEKLAAGGFREIAELVRGELQLSARNPLFELAILQCAKSFGIEGGVEEVFEHADRRVSVEDAAQTLGEALTLGTAFGFTFPELVRQLWTEHHENIDRDDPLLQALHQAGLPEREPIILDEFEQQVLSDLAFFVRAHHPGLLDPLGLTIAGPQ